MSMKEVPILLRLLPPSSKVFPTLNFHPSPSSLNSSADPDTFLKECIREQLAEMSTRNINPPVIMAAF
jgi:hypothetical protein